MAAPPLRTATDNPLTLPFIFFDPFPLTARSVLSSSSTTPPGSPIPPHPGIDQADNPGTLSLPPPFPTPSIPPSYPVMAPTSFYRRAAVSAALVALFSAAPRPVDAQALHEQDGIYFGAWVDPQPGFSDTPFAYNQRLGRNASVFQIAQSMPLPPYNYNTGGGGPAPEYLIENTSTNAAVMLTVYPTTLTGLGPDDFTTLGNQVLACASTIPRARELVEKRGR